MVDLAGYLKVATRPRRSKPRDLEGPEQEMLFGWITQQSWAWDGERCLFSHWPNERRNARGRDGAWVLQRKGVQRGMPDNWLFLPRGRYVGAVSELKQPNASPSMARACRRR